MVGKISNGKSDYNIVVDHIDYELAIEGTLVGIFKTKDDALLYRNVMYGDKVEFFILPLLSLSIKEV